ncbi:MAG TPA: hypothetical protein VFE42_00910 [Chloroflexota bacterium]|nr:hypothetical protein [Chloroflexota bacterium]
MNEAARAPMPYRHTHADRLYVFFWDISLGNLPEGTFTRRRITAVEAKQRIGQAKEDK